MQFCPLLRVYICVLRGEKRGPKWGLRFERLRFSRQWLCYCLLWCDTMRFRQNISTFRRTMLLPLSGKKSISNLCSSTHRRTQNFFFAGGRTVPQAVRDLCLILKAMLRESCPYLRADKQRGYRKSENSMYMMYMMFSVTQNSLSYECLLPDN